MNLMYLLRDDETMIGVISSLSVLMSVVYLLPLFQALFAYEKRVWIEKQLASAEIGGNIDAASKKKLIDAAEPGQSYPIYKLFKFYFASIGIVGVILGFLIMVLPKDLGRDSENWLLFLPLVFGIIIYALYRALFVGQGLWREIAAVFLFIGFTSTTLMAYVNRDFEIYDWLRSDILSFLILGAGFFIIMHLKSTFVSYMYMIAVVIAAPLNSVNVSFDWLYFLTHFIWFFGVAILYIWIPKLKAAKDIGAREIVFGILFTLMMLSLTFTHSAGLYIPTLAIVLPGLYVFSKAYFKKANTIIGKPIEVIVISIVIGLASLLSVNYLMTIASDSISLFEGYSFHKQFVYFILLGLAYGIYYVYDNDLGDNDEEVNPLIAIFPVALFLIAYILGEYGGHYMMTLFLIVLGYQYVSKGIDKKDAIRIWVGASAFVFTIIIKLSDILQEYIKPDSKFLVGLIVFFFGSLFVATVMYVRSQWTVTDESIDSNGPMESNIHQDTIDNVITDSPKED